MVNIGLFILRLHQWLSGRMTSISQRPRNLFVSLWEKGHLKLRIWSLTYKEKKIQRQIQAAVQAAYLEIWALKTNYAPLKSDPALAITLHDLASFYVSGHIFGDLPEDAGNQMRRYREQPAIAEKRKRLRGERSTYYRIIREPGILNIVSAYTSRVIAIQKRSLLNADEDEKVLREASQALERNGYPIPPYATAVAEIKKQDSSVTNELLAQNRWRLKPTTSGILALAGLASASFLVLGFIRAHTILAFTQSSGAEYLGIDDYLVSGVSTIPWQLISVFATWFSVYLEVSKGHIFFGVLSVEDKGELKRELIALAVCTSVFIWAYFSLNILMFAFLYPNIFFFLNKISYYISGKLFQDKLKTFVVISFITFSIVQTILSAITYSHNIINYPDKSGKTNIITSDYMISTKDWTVILVTAKYIILKNVQNGSSRILNLSEVQYINRL